MLFKNQIIFVIFIECNFFSKNKKKRTIFCLLLYNWK